MPLSSIKCQWFVRIFPLIFPFLYTLSRCVYASDSFRSHIIEICMEISTCWAAKLSEEENAEKNFNESSNFPLSELFPLSLASSLTERTFHSIRLFLAASASCCACSVSEKTSPHTITSVFVKMFESRISLTCCTPSQSSLSFSRPFEAKISPSQCRWIFAACEK